MVHKKKRLEIKLLFVTRLFEHPHLKEVRRERLQYADQILLNYVPGAWPKSKKQ